MQTYVHASSKEKYFQFWHVYGSTNLCYMQSISINRYPTTLFSEHFEIYQRLEILTFFICKKMQG